jgi:fatty acid synthase
MRSGECIIDVDLSKEQYEFLAGHAIDGRVLFPATGYLVSSWNRILHSFKLDIECVMK